MRRMEIMKNEKGEVVIGVMVALMVIMMLFGHMGPGQRGHGGNHGHHMMHGHSEKGQQHAHDGSIDKPALTAGEKADEVNAGTK